MPFKTDGSREYRSFTLSPLLDEGKHAYRVSGYYTTWDDPYDMGFGWREQVSRSALAGADMSDVIFQLNHEGPVLARLSNGSMQLGEDEHGATVTADLSGCAAARDLYEAIANGLVTKMSWGFQVAEDGWSDDYDQKVTTIQRVRKVFDVSAVSVPANGGTEIHARSHLDGVIEAEAEERRQRDMEERQRIALMLAVHR